MRGAHLAAPISRLTASTPSHGKPRVFFMLAPDNIDANVKDGRPDAGWAVGDTCALARLSDSFDGLRDNPYFVQTFRRSRPEAGSSSHAQHCQVKQRRRPSCSDTSPENASEADGRSARQRSRSAASR